MPTCRTFSGTERPLLSLTRSSCSASQASRRGWSGTEAISNKVGGHGSGSRRGMRRLKSIAAVLGLLGASVALALGAAEASLRAFPQLMPEEARLRLHWRELEQPVSRPTHIWGSSTRPTMRAASSGTMAISRSPTPPTSMASAIRRPGRNTPRSSCSGIDGVRLRRRRRGRWTSLLANRLPDSRIINLGLIGAAPQQYSRIYETFGQALHPDLVLFCLFPGNDLADAGRFEGWLKPDRRATTHLASESGSKICRCHEASATCSSKATW